LERLQRQIEKELRESVVSGWHVALLHQLIAGAYRGAGQYKRARDAYLRAATQAFHDVYSSIDLMTNSLWAAEECARSAQKGTPLARLHQIQKLNDKGSRFTKEVGDMLNDQRVDAKLSPVIFGGAYPGKYGLTPEQHKAFERIRNANHRRNARLRKQALEHERLQLKKASKK
jgi:hypothetical protein